MSYWNSVLDEVLHKDDNEHTFLFTNQGNLCDRFNAEECISEKISSEIKEGRDLRTYHLGIAYPGVYLTKREAECMFWIVQECTLTQTASKMKLSARTVEFYVKNLKFKMRCNTKKDLIEKILQTTLLQQLEKEGMKIVKH